MPQKIVDLLTKGIEANITDRFRRGNLICLSADSNLIATGDIHGHVRNFQRIVTFADLANNPDRHVVFQEIIQETPAACGGEELKPAQVSERHVLPEVLHGRLPCICARYSTKDSGEKAEGFFIILYRHCHVINP